MNLTASPLLEVRDLSLGAAERVLLSRLAFSARAGERWCIIGRNAAGKSTLLRALAGLHVPQRQGTVLIQGDTRVLDQPQRAAGLRAYLPQQSNDRFDLSVREWLQLHRAAALPDDSLQELATGLDVLHLLERPITQLSGGERQRVGLAGVAVQGAALWLLDEPVSFQDPAHQRALSHWLRAQNTHAIIMSAHDIGWVQHCATHVIALLGTGEWRAGPAQEQLNAQTLQATFGSPWHCVQGHWLPAD